MSDVITSELGVVGTLDAFVAQIADAERLELTSCEVRPGCKAGDNYLGVVRKVTLRGRRRGADADEKEASVTFVYKSQPESVKRREQFRTAEFFANEVVVYNEVLPVFARFQTEKRLPINASFTSYPKCYHADSNAILLEDMSPRGFVMRDRQHPLDLAHCSLIMKEMGRFHALSFALRDQRPQEFDKIKHAVKETLYIPVERTQPTLWMNSVLLAEKKFLERSMFGGDVRYTKPLREFVEGYYLTMLECVRGEAAEPYAVITHGDCWTNNMLFKYGKDPGVPESLCFLDFQIARYSSVVLDLVYVLFSCTEQSLRVAHLDALVKVYHYSLSRFLRQLGSDPDKLFPFKALQTQLSQYSQFGLGTALRFMHLFTSNPATAPDLDAVCDADVAKLGDAMMIGDAECWRRLSGVVEDMVDRGFIG